MGGSLHLSLSLSLSTPVAAGDVWCRHSECVCLSGAVIRGGRGGAACLSYRVCSSARPSARPPAGLGHAGCCRWGMCLSLLPWLVGTHPDPLYHGSCRVAVPPCYRSVCGGVVVPLVMHGCLCSRLFECRRGVCVSVWGGLSWMCLSPSLSHGIHVLHRFPWNPLTPMEIYCLCGIQ